MKSFRLFVEVLFIILLGVETAYLRATRGELEELSQRVQRLSRESGSDTELRPANAPLPSHRDDRPADRPDAPGPAPGRSKDIPTGPLDSVQAEEQVRAIVARELRAVQEREIMAEEGRVALQNQEGRKAVARELDLTDSELQRLVDLGDALTLAENKRENGLPGQRAEVEMTRVSAETERELHRILGESRFEKVVSLRRDHPEFGRYLPVLRPPAVELTANTNMNPPQQAAGPAVRQ
jgi:hypothetical protein